MIKITERYSQSDDWEMGESVEIDVEVDGVKLSLDFHDGEPEDNSLSRNFCDVHSIVSALEVAYDAGKRGMDIEVIYLSGEEDE